MNLSKKSYRLYPKESLYIDGIKVFKSDLKVLKTIIENHIKANDSISFVCMNPHSYILKKIYPDYSQAVSAAQYVLADGIIYWIICKLRRPSLNINRITGRKLLSISIETAIKMKSKIMIICPNQISRNQIQDYMNSKGIDNEFLFFRVPPHKFRISPEDLNNEGDNKFESELNNCDMCLLFLGAPKQEILSIEINKIKKGMICIPVGAVFEELNIQKTFVKKIKTFSSKYGLEWLTRFLLDPRKIWKRIFLTGPLFLITMLFYFFFLTN